MLIARELLNEMVAHAREEYDAECCGMVGYESDGSDTHPRAVRIHRAQNVYAATPGGHSPSARIPGMASKRFEIDGKEVLRAMNEFDDAGLDLGAIYHSHTHTAPYPSQTDVNFARNWPGVEWLIVGLADEEPEVRCYLIEDGEVREVPVEIAEAV
jgi:[CysO sulfur-carrier protein]-S-L-cysteine hydrolase